MLLLIAKNKITSPFPQYCLFTCTTVRLLIADTINLHFFFLYFIYSYSSLSVSPTQFSPTQSPIQPRHIQRNFHEYTMAEETNGYDEKLSMSDIGQQHGITSGISRQQLINRYILL